MNVIVLHFNPSTEVQNFINNHKDYKVLSTNDFMKSNEKKYDTIVICDYYTLLCDTSVKANKIIIWKTVNIGNYEYYGVNLSNEILLQNLLVDNIIKSKGVNGIGADVDTFNF